MEVTMKYFLIGLLTFLGLTYANTTYANGYHHGHRIQQRHWHHHHPHHVHRPNWIAPAIIGGVVTYALTRPYIVEQQPVVVQQIPQPAVVHCTEWREVMQPNGAIVQERTCSQQ